MVLAQDLNISSYSSSIRFPFFGWAQIIENSEMKVYE